MANNTSIPIIVQGNSYTLSIPLQMYYVDDDEMVLRDYTPEVTDKVAVQLKGERRSYTYTPTIDGSTALVELAGTELADRYAVMVSIIKDNGQRLRSYRTDQFFIVESSDDLTPADIIEGLEENVIYLNSSIFVAGEQGEQGEQGVGITSIEKTATSGLVDTYTITLTNGNTYAFTVTNGEDGHDLGLASIINNLNSDSTDDALSAAMGKELKGMVDKSMRTEEGEIINFADLTGKVRGVYKAGVLVTSGWWEGNSSSIKVAVEPSTEYLIGTAFYGGSIPRYIGEWDENDTWLRDTVANDVGIEGSEYTHLKNNLAFIKTSADAHYISIAYLTSAYSASDLAPTMVVKASRIMMPSEYVAFGVRDNGAMDANSIDSFEKTQLSIPLSQLSKECFAETMQAAEFSSASTSSCLVRLYANLPRMLASPLGRALTAGDVVELRFDAKIDNYSGGSVQGYTEMLVTRQGTASTGILDSNSVRTNTFNGDWGSKSMSLTITGTSTPNKVLYIQYSLNFYNVVSGTMLFKNIKLYVNDTYCFDFDSAMGDTPEGNVGQTKDVIADERGIIATKSYVDAKTSTAENWYLGKNWLAFGDSITAPAHSYAMVTAEELGMTCENAGVSGYTSGNVLNQALPLYQATLSTYDVISVMIGTNDFANNVALDTFKSNLRSIFNTILGATYGKVYVAGTPIRRGDMTTNTLNLTLNDYANAFIEVANECGFQLLDQYHNGVTHFDLSNWWASGLVSPSDKLHPTESGQRLIALQWKAFLTSIR